MLNDPRFWFYLTVFFTAAGAARLIRRSPGRRVSPGGLLFLCLAAGALTAYWLFSDALFPSGGKILLILVLSALIPGALTGLCVPFILIPVILPVFLSWYLGVPPVPLVSRLKNRSGICSAIPLRTDGSFWSGRIPGILRLSAV